jgi:transposase
MKNLFTKISKVKFRPTIQVINRKFRRKLTERDKLFVVFLRYGETCNPDFRSPKRDISYVAKVTGLHYGTCYNILKHFVENKYQVIDKRKFNQRAHCVITQELAHYLKSESTLQQWAGLTLDARVKRLKREKGITLSRNTLFSFYQRNKIKYLRADYI